MKSINTLNYHKSAVNCLLLLKDSKIASCSNDTTIKIFSLITQEIEIVLKGHTDYIFYISQQENGNLLSCSRDKSIIIWNINSSIPIHIIKFAHIGSIYKVIPLSLNRIGSCSYDYSIKIWKGNYPYQLLTTFYGHYSSVSSIFYLEQKGVLLSCSRDSTIRIWNLLTYQCESIIKGISCSFWNSFLLFNQNILVISGTNVQLIGLDIFSYIKQWEFKDERINAIYGIIQINTNELLCGCSDGIIGIYDSNTNGFTMIFQAHQNSIYGLININNNSFATSSIDKTIKVWNHSILI